MAMEVENQVASGAYSLSSRATEKLPEPKRPCRSALGGAEEATSSY
ncbi:hypothetical protein B4113_0128 [Geobacillus sp. B4113_201601]|nr:hypothetical protein B4113_0128 [Geobacillus sp. B4113_201601]